MSEIKNDPSKECFVIMPFSDGDSYEKGHFRAVFEDIIKPAVEASGYVPMRADDVQQTNLIHLDILKRLLDAPICICDMSSRNPNVLFELGIRQAFDKPVVLIQEKGTPKIFDISMLRILEYSKEMKYRDVKAVQQDLTEAITATINVEEDSSNVNSIIKLLSLSVPASIPKLDKANREDLTLDMISSQILELTKKIEMSSFDSKRILGQRGMAAVEFERLSRRIDSLEIELNNEGPSSSLFRMAESLDEEIMMARRLVSNPREDDAFAILSHRIHRMMDRLSTK